MSYEPPTEEEMRQVRRKDGRRGGCGSPCCSEDSTTHVHCGDPCSMAITSLRWERAGRPRARYDGDRMPTQVTQHASAPRLGDASASILGEAPGLALLVYAGIAAPFVVGGVAGWRTKDVKIGLASGVAVAAAEWLAALALIGGHL